MKTKTARKPIIFLPILGILTLVIGMIFPILSASAADVNVSNYDEFVAELNNPDSTRIYIHGDIVFKDDVVVNKIIVTEEASTLNLNGHKMTLNKTLETHASTIVTGNGAIETNIKWPIFVTSGDLTIENGTFTAGAVAYSFISPLAGFGGNVNILGGNFDISNIIVNNYGSGKVVVSGGTFISRGDYSEDDDDDAAFMTSDSGSFEINGDVVVESKYRFLGEKFADPSQSRGEVICKKGRIQESFDENDDEQIVEYNTITICGADETLESDEVIEDSFDYKLIDSKVTIPAGITLSNPSARIIVANGSTFTICGEYAGSEDSLIEDGGAIVRECNEEGGAEEETVPPTFDGFTCAVAFLALSSVGFIFSLSRMKTARK